MERREGCNNNDGFNTLVAEEDLEEYPTYHQSHNHKQHVPMFVMSPGRRSRLAVVILALLAAVLLIVDISLGVHYNKLTDTRLTLDDTKHIGNELVKLQDTFKTAVETMNDAKRKLDAEMNLQTQTKWELDHQTKRSKDYEVQIEKVTKDIVKLRAHIPMIDAGCKYCPAGWILMNSICYYFHFSDVAPKKWQTARDFCRLQGGDLAILDSKDKQNVTVNHLLNHPDRLRDTNGFWIGLKDDEEEGTWKWVDGRALAEGYWNDGEPNNENNEDCAAVLRRENFFKAWNDANCQLSKKFICEKAPTSTS